MTGIVLLNMGGPDSLDAVRPFLYNLFSDRYIIRLGPALLQPLIAWMIARKRAPKSKAAYEKIGGRSPLLDITRRQAVGLQRLIREKTGCDIPCVPGMRYWHPRTPDVLKSMAKMGIKNVLAITLYPHYSMATTGSSVMDFKKAAEALGLNYTTIESYPDHPGYIASLSERVKEGIRTINGPFVLIYSAHSLPKSMIEQGDPYLDHLKRTISALEGRTAIKGRLCFQSRSGPVKWLEPATDDVLNQLAESGHRSILVLPISFVSDHIETLYEIDMLYGQMMKDKGVRLYRVPSLNDSQLFMQALFDLAIKRLKEVGWLE